MKKISEILEELRNSIISRNAKMYDDRMNDLVDAIILRKERFGHSKYSKIVEDIRKILSEDENFRKFKVLEKFESMIPEHEKDLGISLKETIKEEIVKLLKESDNISKVRQMIYDFQQGRQSGVPFGIVEAIIESGDELLIDYFVEHLPIFKNLSALKGLDFQSLNILKNEGFKLNFDEEIKTFYYKKFSDNDRVSFEAHFYFPKYSKSRTPICVRTIMENNGTYYWNDAREWDVVYEKDKISKNLENTIKTFLKVFSKILKERTN